MSKPVFVRAAACGLAVVAIGFAYAPAAAQVTQPVVEQVTPRADPDAVPYRRRPGETLSETLEREDGVLDPGMEAGPDMTVIPPDPAPGTTPVIPPEDGLPPQPPQLEPRFDALPLFPWEGER